MDNKIKLLVTQEKFDEVFSIDDWFNFSTLAQSKAYAYMLNFVVNDAGEFVANEEARGLFKTVKKAEWIKYLAEFMKAVDEAFVNPTNGG